MTGKVSTFWTVLPNGEVDRNLRLSVFVTPKLTGPPGDQLSLIDYPIAANWNEAVKGIRFKLFAKSGGATFEVGEGTSYTPTNRGEIGLDSELWKQVFQPDTTLVLPEPNTQEAGFFRQNESTQNDIVGVHYRNRIIDQLVFESRLVHARSALLEPGASPQPPYIASEGDEERALQTIDRFVEIASADDGVVNLQQNVFPTKTDGLYSYGRAEAVTSQFIENNDQEDSQFRRSFLNADSTSLNTELSDRDIVANYELFTLYHRHGVKNRNYQIRASSTDSPDFPEFNFSEQTIFEIEDADHGKLMEFAEPLPVVLPDIQSVRDGFEVRLFYNPSETGPESNQTNGQTLFEKFRNPIDGSLNSQRIQTSAGNTFSTGTSGNNLKPFRGVVVGKNNAGTWNIRPIELKDFHEIVSGLASYPILLRKLGLLFDIEFSVDDLPVGDNEFCILAEPQFDNPNLQDLSVYPLWSCVSRAELTARLGDGTRLKSFSMATRSGKGSLGGLKVLDPSKSQRAIGFNTYDLDSVAYKVFEKAISDGTSPSLGSSDPLHESNAYSVDDRIGIPGSPSSVAKEYGTLGWPRLEEDFRQPAARSTGISMFLDLEGKNAVEQFKTKLTDYKTVLRSNNPDVYWPDKSASSSDLFEEDVTVGCKVDVFVEQGDSLPPGEFSHWYSLCARQLSFNFGPQSTYGNYLAPADEFWVETAADQEVDENGSTQLRVNDYLFRWDGWSLVAPHPGNPAPETGADSDKDWQRSTGLVAYSEAEAISLPKLRYGRSYRFRTRWADLAGNAVHFEYANAYLGQAGSTNDQLLSSETVTYRRHDPISPPALYALQPPGPGSKTSKQSGKGDPKVGPDSADVLVIRSGEGVASNLATAQWLVLPPDTDFQEAEWAGMFDGFRSPDVAYDVMEKYTGALPERFDVTFLNSITWPNGQLGTPYLPDGYAAAAAFCFLPGRERSRNTRPNSFTKRFDDAVSSHLGVSFRLNRNITSARSPYSKPFELLLKNTATRSSEFKSGTLKVGLPAGEQQLVMLSSSPDKERLDHFELIHQAFSSDRPVIAQSELNSVSLSGISLKAQQPKVLESISKGLNWPISPSKPIRMIHAVPKPLMAPTFSEQLKITNRVTGGNAVVFEDPGLKFHRVSTGKIDIYAEWDEYSDTPGDPEFPRIRRERRHCFKCDIPLPDLTIEPDQTHLEFDIGSRHSFPSNKHLAVNYVAIATTRYLEYFNEDITTDLANITIESEPSCELAAFNTSPPPPPEIAYILPLFIWNEERTETSPSPSTDINRRTGFRIYMRRGWFKSGKDEKLAVLLQSDAVRAQNSGDLSNSELPLTHWGSDPTVYDRNPVKSQLDLSHFKGAVDLIKACELALEYDASNPPRPGAVTTRCGSACATCILSAVDGIDLPPPEVPAHLETLVGNRKEQRRKSRLADKQGPDLHPENEVAMDVAAYEVKCDVGKDLLYVDVEISDSLAYMPFVKFALGRYQKHSAKYCHLSKIVNADFVQLSPSRTLTYTSEVGNPTNTTFVITGPAPGYVERGVRTNFLRVYGDQNKISPSQLPLRVEPVWDEESRLYRWEFTLNTVTSTKILIEEIEDTGPENSERKIASFSINLGKS